MPVTPFFKHRLEINDLLAASRCFLGDQTKRKPFKVLGMFRVPKGNSDQNFLGIHNFIDYISKA